MNTNKINTMEDVNILNLTEETEYISKVTDIPYDTVLDIIKGIDVYYYLVGIQDELTFDEDECEMFIDGSIQHQEYDPDYVVDDDEMLAFISSHTDIPDEIIEAVMREDFKYQYASPTPVLQRQSDTWDKETKAALRTALLDCMFKNPHGEKLTPSNAYKYSSGLFTAINRTNMPKLKIRAEIDEKSFYEVLKDKEIPPDLSLNHFEWEIDHSYVDEDCTVFVIKAKALLI